MAWVTVPRPRWPGLLRQALRKQSLFSITMGSLLHDPWLCSWPSHVGPSSSTYPGLHGLCLGVHRVSPLGEMEEEFLYWNVVRAFPYSKNMVQFPSGVPDPEWVARDLTVTVQESSPFGSLSPFERWRQFSLLGLVSHSSFEEFLASWCATCPKAQARWFPI